MTTLFKTLVADKQKELAISYSIKLHSFINSSSNPIELTLGKHTFTFSTEPDAVTYTLSYEGELVKTDQIPLGVDRLAMAAKLSEDTTVIALPNADNVYASQVNIIHVDRVLMDLISTPPDYGWDAKYLSLIRKLQNMSKPFSVTYGDVTTTITYSNMMVYVQTRVPNRFNRTYWFGRTGTIPDICEVLNQQYSEIEFPVVVPNTHEIHVLLNDLCAP